VQLHYYRDPRGNFGDDLNPWLWPRLLPRPPGECCGDALFVGVGTLLNDRLPAAPRTVVFGTGAGYGPPPRVAGEWRVYCVRGRRTAAALGLPERAAAGDAALLVRRLIEPAGAQEHPASFMPHHRTAERADWRGLCEAAGVHYLDPAAPVGETLEAIRRSAVVVAEAMHAAVVADALRVPWVPVRTSAHVLEFKWQDWSESVAVPHQFEPLPPLPPAPANCAGPPPAPAEVGARLAWLARRGPRRLSPESVFRHVYRRLEDALGALVADA
jgi:succinoglycan biosynthesis protein ExoV